MTTEYQQAAMDALDVAADRLEKRAAEFEAEGGDSLLIASVLRAEAKVIRAGCHIYEERKHEPVAGMTAREVAAHSIEGLGLLETKCDLCEGRGGEYGGTDWTRCPQCCGGGYLPTELGEKLVKLIRHNLRRITEELSDG